MVRLIKYLFLVGGISCIFSYSLFLIINYGLRNQKNDTFPVIKELVQSNENHQVLFIGSSLAKNNINPIVFDSISKLNSYNFGYPGAKIEHSYMIINRYLHSNHPYPKMILIMLEPYVLDSTIDINFPVQYYPYYKDTMIYNFVSKYDSDIKMIKYLPFLGITKYNDYLKNLGIMGVLFPNRLTSTLKKGFEPLFENSWKTEIVLPENKTNVVIIPKKRSYSGLKYMETICKTCKEKNIKLYFIIPPKFHPNGSKTSESKGDFFTKLQPFIEKYSVKILDHSNLDICQKKEMFFDWHHLNNKGARIYTEFLNSNLIFN